MLAQIAEFGSQPAQRFADGLCFDLGRIALPGINTERRWNYYLYPHNQFLLNETTAWLRDRESQFLRKRTPIGHRSTATKSFPQACRWLRSQSHSYTTARHARGHTGWAAPDGLDANDTSRLRPAPFRERPFS